MCVTDLEPDLDDLDLDDLDLDHEITEDEQAPSPGQPGPDPQPAGGQAPGVAWGRAGQHTAAG
jgi:hypothetical protein